jgi:hypothetical protein
MARRLVRAMRLQIGWPNTGRSAGTSEYAPTSALARSREFGEAGPVDAHVFNTSQILNALLERQQMIFDAQDSPLIGGEPEGVDEEFGWIPSTRRNPVELL